MSRGFEMKRIFFAKMCVYVLTATMLTTACLNSESDYNDVTAEVDGLRTELETTRKENEILTAALANISQEKERLSAALQSYEPAPAAGEASSSGVALAGDRDAADSAAGSNPPAPGGRVHVAQPGDTLSNIAARYQTDVNTLLALNPYLTRRNAQMVWESDNIQLP
jgi:LysM repeat protein